MIFLGIDTSCYTTSVAAVDENGQLICSARKLLSVAEGERGLRQSEAFFKHVNNFPEIYKQLTEKIDTKEIAAVCVSTQPRGMTSSYMPVFYAGRRMAETIAMTLNVPLYATDHQQGHIQAALYNNKMPQKQFCAVHLSGGTSEVLLVEEKETEFKIRILAQSTDINAGQFIDRLGVLMGCPFPAGKYIDKKAIEYKGDRLTLPISALMDQCSFSGCEAAATREYQNSTNVDKLSEAIMSAVARTVAKMAGGAAHYAGINDILMAGGVSSSEYLRKNLPVLFEKRGGSFNLYFTAPELSADNAVGVALLCRKKFLRGNK